MQVILASHLKELSTSGLTGVVSFVLLVMVSVRVLLGSTWLVVKHLWRKATRPVAGRFSGKKARSDKGIVAAAAALPL